jgi:mono/diheme cytochrome c family protein
MMTAPALVVAALAAAAAFGAVMLLSARGDEASEPAAGSTTGLAVFSRMGCGSCHQLGAADSNGTIGPSLDERLDGHTATSLKARIVAPPETSLMPKDFAERMSDRELDSLVGFLLAARP